MSVRPFEPTPGYVYQPTPSQIRRYHSLEGQPVAQKAFAEQLGKFLGWEAAREKQYAEWKQSVESQYPATQYKVSFTGEQATITPLVTRYTGIPRTGRDYGKLEPEAREAFRAIEAQREREARSDIIPWSKRGVPTGRQGLAEYDIPSSFGVGARAPSSSIPSTNIASPTFAGYELTQYKTLLPEMAKTHQAIRPESERYFEEFQELNRVKSASELQGADVPLFEAMRRTLFEQPGVVGQLVEAMPFVQLFGMVGIGIVKEVESSVGMIEALVMQPSGRSYIRTLGGSLVGEGISLATGQPVGQQIDAYGKSLTPQPGGEVIGEVMGMYLSGKAIAFVGGKFLGWAGRNIASPIGKRIPQVIKSPVLKATEKVTTFTSQHITQPVLSRISKIPLVGSRLVKGKIMVIDDAAEYAFSFGDDAGRFASARVTQLKTKVVPSSYDYALWLDDFLKEFKPKSFHGMGTQTGISSYQTMGKMPIPIRGTFDVTRPVAPYISATLGGTKTLQSFAYGVPGISSLTKTVGYKAGKHIGYVASQTLGLSLTAPIPGAKMVSRHFLVTEFLGTISPSMKKQLLGKLGAQVMGGLPITQQLGRVGIRLIGTEMIGTSIVGASTTSFISPVARLVIPTAITPILRGITYNIPEVRSLPLQTPRATTRQREIVAPIPAIDTQPTQVPTPKRLQRQAAIPSMRVEFPQGVGNIPFISPRSHLQPLTYPIQAAQKQLVTPKLDIPSPISPSIPPGLLFPSAFGGLELPRKKGLGFGKWHKRSHKIKSPGDLFRDFMGGKHRK